MWRRFWRWVRGRLRRWLLEDEVDLNALATRVSEVVRDRVQDR